jgi:sugar phosphate isomerase/epimerase
MMNSNVSRRKMLQLLASALPMVSIASPIVAAEVASQKRLGIGMHSYGAHWKAARDGHAKARFSDTLEFLEYAHQLGAGGVQVSIGNKDLNYAAKIRAKAEAYEMYFEGQLALPKEESDLDRFDSELRLAKEAGASVVRTALLSGRRYETFDSAEAFQKFRTQSWRSLRLAEPVLKRHRLRLAIENHKDWLVPELLEWLHRLSSESVGVCVDTGNSIALMEDPMQVVDAYAPFAASTHIKDMGVREYAEGFLLSEVPLGTGFLDLHRILTVLQTANRKLQFNLEMITRDPLQVPCLTEKYWTTMPATPAQRLAETLARIKRVPATQPLPHTTGLDTDEQLRLEDENVRKSLAYAREHLRL